MSRVHARVGAWAGLGRFLLSFEYRALLPVSFLHGVAYTSSTYMRYAQIPWQHGIPMCAEHTWTSKPLGLSCTQSCRHAMPACSGFHVECKRLMLAWWQHRCLMAQSPCGSGTHVPSHAHSATCIGQSIHPQITQLKKHSTKIGCKNWTQYPPYIWARHEPKESWRLNQ